MKAQKFKESFTLALTNVVANEFARANSKDFEVVAKSLWYSEDDLVGAMNFAMLNKLQNDDQKRRLLYMVERLRRFGCVTHENKKAMKGFVEKWSELKPSELDNHYKSLVDNHRLDELAFSWGLHEDLSLRLQDVLHFQTRHYADSQKNRHGYSELGG